MLLSTFWWDIVLRRVGFRWLARRSASARYRRAARRFRNLATSMGGVWIKVGQFLSARLDVLPPSITDELAGLQDDVAAVPFEDMKKVVESAFGKPLTEIYAWFDPEPLASASLGQVHKAELPEGDRVVSKIQRPMIRQIIEVDLRALQTVIRWLKRYRPITRRADLDALFTEFSRTLWEEVDYLAEADNARRFAEMFSGDPGIRIPSVYDSYTNAQVLTLEDVYFVKITDFAAIESIGVDRREVASRLFETYLKQIFVESFFHADPHPGNLFVESLETGEWRLVFVDFGMVGRLTDEAREGLKDLAIAVGTRDLSRLLRSYQELDVLLPGADLERIREAEAAFFDRFWGRSMRELAQIHPREMRQFALQFRDLVYEMPFQIPTDLIFLGRCLAILSGMCTGLDPEFNLFEGLRPFAQQLIEAEAGGMMESFWDALVEQIRALATLPSKLEATLNDIQRGRFTVIAKADPQLERQLGGLIRAINRLVRSVVFGALLLVGALFYANGDRLIGGVSLGLALIFLLLVIRG